MSRSAYRRPYLLQVIEPPIGRAFIADTTPDPLLRIQRGLIGWQEVQPYLGMAVEEPVDLLSPMPTRSIHIEPHRVASQPAHHLPEYPQEAVPISSDRPHQTVTSQQRGDPSRQIQPLLVLAGGGNAQALTPQRPASSKTGMHRKAALILEDHRFLRSQRVEFFLTPAENAWPEPSALEDTRRKPAWVDTPTDAASSGPVARSDESRTGALHARPRSAHPIALDASQPSREAAADAPPAPCGCRTSVDSDVQAWEQPATPEDRECSRPDATGSNWPGGSPTLPRSTQAAAPRRATTTLRSSDRSTLQESVWPAKPTSPGWPRDG